MFENLTIFQTSSAMARHAEQSQALISQNVANSDTPGFIGKKMPPFAEHFAPSGASNAQRATREGHLNGIADGTGMAAIEMREGGSLNENNISLESELLKSAEAKSEHERALAIYKSALDMLHVAVRTR